MAVTIVGIDCATQAKKTGLARGTFENGRAQIDDVIIGARNISIVDTIADWISNSQNVLIAMDAPLGWPIALGKQFHAHEAGNPIKVEPNYFFDDQQTGSSGLRLENNL